MIGKGLTGRQEAFCYILTDLTVSATDAFSTFFFLLVYCVGVIQLNKKSSGTFLALHTALIKTNCPVEAKVERGKPGRRPHAHKPRLPSAAPFPRQLMASFFTQEPKALHRRHTRQQPHTESEGTRHTSTQQLISLHETGGSLHQGWFW